MDVNSSFNTSLMDHSSSKNGILLHTKWYFVSCLYTGDMYADPSYIVYVGRDKFEVDWSQ